MKNFDTMNEKDLMNFYTDVMKNPVKISRKLFPDKPKNYVIATKALAAYAANSVTAMRLRAQGKIIESDSYFRICNHIYENELPTYAKW